jgi:flagellar motility protein MotE (MotC chaperone)
MEYVTKVEDWVISTFALALLVYGSFLSFRRVPQERAEAKQQEIDRAKEALRNALRQTLPNIQRDWLKRFSQHPKDEVENAYSHLDDALHTYGKKIEEEQQRIERQYKNTEEM